MNGTSEILRSPSAWLPVVLAALGLAGATGYILMFGIAEHPDERGPARLFQLLMLLQAGSIAWFGLGWVPACASSGRRYRDRPVLVHALPIAAVVVAEP